MVLSDSRREIILALAENRMNASKVGRKLFMHRNNVIYHCDRIKAITGKDPLDFYDLYDLVQMAKGGARKLIEEAPAVDAVEVVRCKDCKRSSKNGGDCERTLAITSRDYVLEQNVTEYIALEFCSYGERKDDES